MDSWWMNWRFYVVSFVSLLGMLALFVFILLRRRSSLGRALDQKGSFFEYSWVNIPIDNELKTHLPVHYRLEGDPKKPLIILIHGLGANLNCWRRIIPLLKEEFQVLAFDLPGFGLTPNPDHFFGENPDQLTKLVVSLMDKLELKGPAYLVGNSLGGVISLSLMEKHQDRFSKALLINPALSRKLVKLQLDRYVWLAGPIARVLNRGALAWLYARTLAKPQDLEPEVVDHLAKNYIRNPAGIQNFAKYVRLIQDQGVPEVNYSNCLFLFSGGDRVVTSFHQQRIHKYFPQAQTLFHPSGGHQFQEDEPDWLKQQLSHFFRPELSKAL